MAATSHKSADLATLRRAIRAECNKQGIDDDTRRALMLDQARVTSSTELDLAGARRVLDRLRKTGGKQEGEWSFVFRVQPARQIHLKKLYHLAKDLRVTRAYIEGIANQMAGAAETRLEFCDADRLHQIVQAVEVFKRRNQGKEATQ